MTAAAPASALLGPLDGLDGLREKFRGALVGGAVGDGLGAGFEGHAGSVPEAAITAAERGSETLPYTDD